jgi:hypothetical protein
MEVLVAVRPYVSDDDSVRWVRRMDALSKLPTRVEDWKQAVKHHDPYVTPINKVIESDAHQCRVADRSGSHNIRSCWILSRIAGRGGWTPEEGAHLMDVTMTVIEIAYPFDPEGLGPNNSSRWNEDVIRAVSEIIARNEETAIDFDLERVAHVLASRGVGVWKNEAKSSALRVWDYMGATTVVGYNKGISRRRHLNW